MNPWQLGTAFALDLILGDPKWLPHPVRVIGRSVTVLEPALRRWAASRLGERWAGVLLTITVVLSAYGIAWLLIALTAMIHPVLAMAITIYLAFTVLAVRSLGDEARGVLDRLRGSDLVSARQWLSRIVGRETDQLSQDGVIRATVETVAENTSDGVVAPLFYLALGGVPLAMAYKAINTLDSMVGYPIPPYREFGWASARLDDLANYLPARITGLLMVLGAGLLFGQARPAWKIMRRDGRKHDSPNAGIPEAAAAGALGIQLGGPSRHSGLVKEKPWLSDAVNDIQANHIAQVIRLMRTVSFMMLILCLMALSVF
ncbi:MAG: cobalamin biosynthesis protein CobD [Nitrospirae bacterium]|nr:cobalamin biosynthesis protein CobD [Nitrospirota bacterium]